MSNADAGIPFQPDSLQRWHRRSRPVSARKLLVNVQSINVIVPHADDETLGCGGLIAVAATLGMKITVTVCTDGAASHPGSAEWPPVRLARRRRHEIRAAVRRLTRGAGRLIFGTARDGTLSEHSRCGRGLVGADLFVTCWRDDSHPDHCAAFRIVSTAASRRRIPLLAFPLWVLTTDRAVPRLPILKISVANYLLAKRAALRCHRSQTGRLITDSDGFVLTEDLQRLFIRPDEIYVRVAPPTCRKRI